MSPAPARIVLASASPRRRELLARAGLDFEVLASDVDETLPTGLRPLEAAQSLAERKARAVATRIDGPARILAADTLVVLDATGREPCFLGKPADEREAAEMLRRLSGSRHAVITGICALRVPGGEALRDVECTWVTMRVLLSSEIDAYVASGEWRDKAGGYAIQESADRFVTALEEGGFDNVVGLPVARCLALLRQACLAAPGAEG